MVAYSLDVTAYKLPLAVVAAHGLSDLTSWHTLVVYPLAALLPSFAVTPVFCALSVLHFSDDAGLFASLALHALLAAASRLRGRDRAFMLVAGYSFLVHVPCHLRRLWKSRRRAACALVVGGGAMSAALRRRLPDVLVFSDALQRIVVAHVLVELIHAVEALPP